VLEAAQRASQRLLAGAGDRVRRGIQVAVAGLAGGPDQGAVV
jgi:hypothetical protein